MKTIFAAALIMLTLGLNKAHGTGNPSVNKAIETSLRKNFKDATNIEWDNTKDFAKATFIFLGHRLQAYFDFSGELLGSVRVIQFSELPISVVNCIDKRFPGTDCLEVLEISNTDGTSYRLLMEKENKRFHVKIDASGRSVQVFKN